MIRSPVTARIVRVFQQQHVGLSLATSHSRGGHQRFLSELSRGVVLRNSGLVLRQRQQYYATKRIVRQSSTSSSQTDRQEEGRGPVRRFLLGILPIFNVLGWGSVVYVVVMHVGSVGVTTGHSMSPTINPSVGDKDFVLLNRFVFTKFWYMLQETDVYRSLFASDPYPFSVGDVVFLTSPFNPNMMTCKRVLALPGDMVSFEDTKGRTHKMRIPPRHVWVEGDVSVDGGDRPVRTSRDSRQYGPVHMDLIQSRADLILWPPARFGRIPPRPGFDLEHMRHIRQVRQMRSQYGRRGTRHAGRAHSDDSPLTPYIEWEWTTDDAAKQGMNLLQEEAAKSSDRPRRKRKINDEERAELMRQIWNNASRGGRLGDDAKDE